MHVCACAPVFVQRLRPVCAAGLRGPRCIVAASVAVAFLLLLLRCVVAVVGAALAATRPVLLLVPPAGGAHRGLLRGAARQRSRTAQGVTPHFALK